MTSQVNEAVSLQTRENDFHQLRILSSTSFSTCGMERALFLTDILEEHEIPAHPSMFVVPITNKKLSCKSNHGYFFYPT